MSIRRSLPAAAILALAACPPLWGVLPASAALAAQEEGDAGDLPATAQVLSDRPHDSIGGELDGNEDVDMYRVCVEAGGSFSATTVGRTTLDTQLFLFDTGGVGIYANDDAGAVRQSLLPAADPLTPTARGEYLLAVSAYDRDPQSANGAIFNNVSSLTGATGRGADAPLSAWLGRARSQGSYDIGLTGLGSCETVPPTVDLRSPADGTAVSLDEPVEVDFSCADEGGSGLASCEGSLPDGAMLDTSTLGPRVVSVTARDGAGNETVASATVEVVDRGAPRIEIRSPAEGAVFTAGAQVEADYECSDEPAGTGVTSCVGDVPDGAPLDTASPGPHSFTVDATDGAGNSSSSTVSYEVVPAAVFGGFLWPLRDFPAVNRWIAGATLPVRFELRGGEGRNPLAGGYPQVAEVECGAREQPLTGEPARGRWLRARPERERYRFRWRTERDWAGSCRQLILRLGDGTATRAEFRFRRGGWWFW